MTAAAYFDTILMLSHAEEWALAWNVLTGVGALAIAAWVAMALGLGANPFPTLGWISLGVMCACLTDWVTLILILMLLMG